jgi:hypothetical protein
MFENASYGKALEENAFKAKVHRGNTWMGNT